MPAEISSAARVYDPSSSAGRSEEIKEVTMEVNNDTQAAAFGGEGGGTRRRRRGNRRTRRTAGLEAQEGGDNGMEATVEKVDTVAAPVKTVPPPKALPPLVGGSVSGPKKAPIVVLAPAKKKPAKVMLVPKSKEGSLPVTAASKQHLARKTFKAKRVRVTIDNTAKTQKRRRQILQSVEDMPEEKIRELAVGVRLSRRDSVAKVPVALLRQMIKDYQTVKGALI